MTERLFRCAGDIQFEDIPPVLGQVVDVKLKPFSETCNYLQYQKPLTEEHPYFFAQIRYLSDTSVVSLGIAGRDIDDDVHPGNWIGSVGYLNTGRCYTSHSDLGNSASASVGIGDIFGVLVTYFGKKWSTVMFVRNGTPVATRYVFEENLNNLLPTIALENGPIELGLMWPESVLSYPKFSERNLWQWIRPKQTLYNSSDRSFSATPPVTSGVSIQSPVPLSLDIQHFEVIVLEASPEGQGPIISIDSCSPMYPPPTCGLLHDYFRWVPDGKRMKTKAGQRMGWGLHFNPAQRDSSEFDARAEQLVVCFVTIDVNVVFAKMMVQPEGGFYPVVILNSVARRVRVDVESNRTVLVTQHLDELYAQLHIQASANLLEHSRLRDITSEEFKMSDGFRVSIGEAYVNVLLPKDQKGIHVLQYLVPLRRDCPYFCVEIKRKGDSSVLCVGIADQEFPLNRYPGRLHNTVGYHSRDGKMYHNDKCNGNMTGHKYGKGDCIGVEVDHFGKDLSVILFRKNCRPVGTRFHSQPDHSKFCPTIAVCGNGSDVELNIVFQNRTAPPPVFQVANVEHWCVPYRAHVDQTNNIISIDPGHNEVEAIQAPYSLDRNYNHFEVEFVDEFDDTTPPPAIALCTASPLDPPSLSNFRQDFLRFWATGEARKAVKKGDLMGWGQLYPDQQTESGGDNEEDELVICYLTINRDIVLTRVMYAPPGGFYPVVLLPVGVSRVKLNFSATIITGHPFTDDAIQQLLNEARQLIQAEHQRLEQGTEPEEWDNEENKSKYLKPVPITPANLHRFKEFREKYRPDQLQGLRKRPSKQDNFVEMMLGEEEAGGEGEEGGPSQMSSSHGTDATNTPTASPSRRGDTVRKSSQPNAHVETLQSIRTSNPFVSKDDTRTSNLQQPTDCQSTHALREESRDEQVRKSTSAPSGSTRTPSSRTCSIL